MNYYIMHNLTLPKEEDLITQPIRIKSTKEYYTCTCGIIVNKYNRAQHKRTIKHKKLINKLSVDKRNHNIILDVDYFKLQFE